MNHAHVLILEDDPLSIAILESWLRHIGAVVTAATSVEAADAALGCSEFDLIVSDVQLPGNSRLEWVTRVVQQDFPPPLVLLTGSPQLETAVQAANLPIAGYLLKPPDFQSMQVLLQRLITSHRRRRELRTLAGDAASLLSGLKEKGEETLSQKLAHLAQCLTAEAAMPPRAMPGTQVDPCWRNAIAETIGVLEKTKHSFRSKDLGQLRLRLQQMLALGEAA